MTISWLIAIVGTALSCLFAACNYALRTFNHIRMEEELARRGRGAEMTHAFDRLGRLILATATLRILLNVAVILAIVRLVGGRSLPGGPARLVVGGVVAFAVVLVFSVAIPNAWARYAGERLLVSTLGLLHIVTPLLAPITGLLHGLDELVRRLIGAPRVSEDNEHVERRILSAVTEGQREGAVDAQEKRMIESVLQFQDTRADQIMTPRTDIVAVDVTADMPAALERIHQAGHSRIPVYEGNLDNITGLLYAKDLLWELAQDPSGGVGATVRSVMRPPLFVPESRPVNDLLNDLRRTQVHMAIVLDEFGGTAGLVTIEDILEEIVGEIADEHEQPDAALIRPADAGGWDVDGRAHVDDVNRQLGTTLPEDDDYDTIAGCVIASLGRIPKTGETLARDGVTIAVTAAEPRRVVKLRITKGATATSEN